MSQAQPITGRPRIDQFKDLANCLRDILGELPDQDDITDALNVAVKLDRMLEFVREFPSADSLNAMTTAVASLNRKVDSLKDDTLEDHRVILNELKEQSRTADVKLNSILEKLDALAADHDVTQKMITTENWTTYDYVHPLWRNEEWRDVGEALAEATTSISTKVFGLMNSLYSAGTYVKFGILAAGKTETAELTDERSVSATVHNSSGVEFSLPDRLPKGAKLRVYSSIRSDFKDTPTDTRVRVTTRHTEWGGHVYAYYQSDEEVSVAYDWQYNSSLVTHTPYRHRVYKVPDESSRWTSLGTLSREADFEGRTSEWLCLPSDPEDRVKWVRCRMTFTKADETTFVKSTRAVAVHEAGKGSMRVTPIFFS